jgi:hypothetical protein
VVAHDGRWTLRWCEHSTGDRLDDGNLACVDTRVWSRGNWGKMAPTGGPHLLATTVWEWAGRPTRARRWAGVGVELGRLRRKRRTMIFSILNSFPIE